MSDQFVLLSSLVIVFKPFLSLSFFLFSVSFIFSQKQSMAYRYVASIDMFQVMRTTQRSSDQHQASPANRSEHDSCDCHVGSGTLTCIMFGPHSVMLFYINRLETFSPFWMFHPLYCFYKSNMINIIWQNKFQRNS